MIGYVYRIKFLLTGQYYVGSRYSNKLNQNNIKNDLWHRYFTSSKLIKNLIKVYGKNSFEYKITKIFLNPVEAKNYEIRLLKRIDAKNNLKMLNQSNSTFEKAPKLRWITNGIIDTMISINKDIPPGFYLGRSQNNRNRNYKNSPLKGRITVIDKITNNKIMIEQKDFNSKLHTKSKNDFNKGRIWCYCPLTKQSKIVLTEKEIPANWVKGNPNRKKSTWYHDPNTKINYQIQSNDIPQKNLVKGRYYPFKWYINKLTGETIHCKEGTQPADFIQGRKLEISKIKKEKNEKR